MADRPVFGVTARLFFLCACLMAVLMPRHANAEMQDMNTAVLQALDKVTARTPKFEVRVGKTVRFGTLYIAVQACRKAPPVEQPESAAFIQVWEQKEGEESKWIFSGWMFASSPALSAMDHAIYDVWVIDCKNADTSEASVKRDGEEAEAESDASRPDEDGHDVADAPSPEDAKKDASGASENAESASGNGEDGGSE